MLGHGTPRPTKVLIVDDDATFRVTTSRILTGAGYDCRDASSGAEARERLNADADIGAMLCDIGMPDEPGLDLLDAVVADFPHVAVVMTTGLDDPPTATRAFEIGAYGYLIKPFTASEILIALAGAVRRSELEAARRSQVRGLEQSLARMRAVHGVVARIESGAAGRSDDDDAETIDRLARAVSLRDEETGAHIQRMSRYSALLAERVGLGGLSADEVRLASALHDIGKIGVSDTILLKPGPLSADEHTAIRRHAEIGYRLLAAASSPLLRTAAGIARGHHEWWDGSGYPRGLLGDEIPPETRIAAVADVFDALTSHRVYRPALPVDSALEIMTELRGRQFEPRLLDAFVGSIDETQAIRAAYPDREDGARIRVLVVDDHEVFVQSLVRLLGSEPNIRVVGSAATAAEAVKAAAAYEPDVVLMDFELPDGDGARATEAIKTLMPEVHVVMLTGRTDQQVLMRAIGASCVGFVAKTDGVDKVIDAIQSAHSGEEPARIAELPRLLTQLRPTSRGLGSDLTPRELEVLRLMAAGQTNKVLAEQLHLSVNTIRNHVQEVLYKLGAHSKLEAVATAVREGIIERDHLSAGG